MPDEILFGGVGIPRHAPARDGSDYEPDAPEPSLEGLINIIRSHGWNTVNLTAVGKLGSPGGNISGISTVTNLQSIINASVAGRAAGVHLTYHQRVARIFNAHETFQHISAFIIRPA
jgi:hypothetical protein